MRFISGGGAYSSRSTPRKVIRTPPADVKTDEVATSLFGHYLNYRGSPAHRLDVAVGQQRRVEDHRLHPVQVPDTDSADLRVIEHRHDVVDIGAVPYDRRIS